uniref:TauD/TfdA dioxygenase family protein n=1 Tax=Brucella pseudintermedia TaxID=370111 RepID=UPI00158851A4|nr:TauD/TfdA family dioxygenase [Brucella pseudintermedia]
MPLTTRELGPGFALEISGISNSFPNDPDELQKIYDYFLSRKVIVIRNARISAAAFVEFSKLFGAADPHHVAAVRHPSEPVITVLSNQDEIGRSPEMKKFGAGWHSDYSYLRTPSKATMLLGVEVPEEGGDTLFADTAQAFEALPDHLQKQILGRKVRHEYRFMKDRSHPGARWNMLSEAEQAATPEVQHPLVIRHPETGKNCLFIAPSAIAGIKGIADMEEEESDALLSQLFAHMTLPAFVYRHQWRPYDLVVWDNRSTIHAATTDQLPSDRVRRMYRITTNGSEPIAA